MRRPFRLPWLCPLVALLIGAPADAALKKFYLNTITLNQAPQTSPPTLVVGADSAPSAPFDTAVVDDATPGSPRLRRFNFKSDSTITVEVPQLAGPGSAIFLSNNFIEGTGPPVKPSVFTGSGSTAPGSTLAWGVVTGWTVTGSQYCSSSPVLLCSLARLEHGTTSEPQFSSDFYDLGTWTFHGTGFTATPFVHQYSTQHFGNAQRWTRGFSVVDATVPALPLLGVGLLIGTLGLAALDLLRRERKR